MGLISMELNYLVITFVTILIIGLIRVVIRYRNHNEDIKFASTYLENYQKFINKISQDQLDHELYYLLIRQTDKIQKQIGLFGIVDYKPPFSRRVIQNYQLIVNTLPEIRTGMAHPADMASIEDILIRYLGSEEEQNSVYYRNLFNPFIWLREGVRFILILPFLILEWAGVISEESSNTINEGGFFSFISGIIAIIGFIATIVGLVVDWEQFVQTVKRLLGI